MTDRAALNYSDKCPECNGGGYLFHWIEEPGYGCGGYEVCEPCPVCKSKRRVEDLSGIPDEHHDASFEKFRFDVYSVSMNEFRKLPESFVANFEEWHKRGLGLYLWSQTPGSGKTYLACCLGRSVSIRYDLQLRFVSAVDYINAVGQSYNTEGQRDPSSVYRECEILILDDIGAQMKKPWVEQEMLRLIDTRNKSGAITIYTSNLSPEDLDSSWRILGRIRDKAVSVRFPEESIRDKMAMARQKAFLKSVVFV